MGNIFRKKDAYIDRVNRSTFDLSFVNNLTMKFGAITPVCLLPASFGDSFQINARFNLQLLPTVFPSHDIRPTLCAVTFCLCSYSYPLGRLDGIFWW